MAQRWRRAAAVMLLAMGLGACGGGGAGDPVAGSGSPPAPVTGRGRLDDAITLNVVTPAEIVAGLQKPDTRAPRITPVYAVANYRLIYRTIDGHGRELTASGLISVPVKPPGAISPVISYQHATIFNDVEAPSMHAQGDEAAVIMASLGYIVIAADYVGFGTSKGTEHPYLLAKPTAAAVLDLLTAARTWRRDKQVADNGQLFLIGYSEGGYATMAAHRAMQTEQAVDLAGLVFSMPGAGPYDVVVTLDELLRRVRVEYPLLGAVINPGPAALPRLECAQRDPARPVQLAGPQRFRRQLPDRRHGQLLGRRRYDHHPRQQRPATGRRRCRSTCTTVATTRRYRSPARRQRSGP